MRLRHHSKRVQQCRLKCGRPEDKANGWGHCAECEATWRSSPEHAEHMRQERLGHVLGVIGLMSKWRARRAVEVDPANDGGVL